MHDVTRIDISAYSRVRMMAAAKGGQGSYGPEPVATGRVPRSALTRESEESVIAEKLEGASLVAKRTRVSSHGTGRGESGARRAARGLFLFLFFLECLPTTGEAVPALLTDFLKNLIADTDYIAELTIRDSTTERFAHSTLRTRHTAIVESVLMQGSGPRMVPQDSLVFTTEGGWKALRSKSPPSPLCCRRAKAIC